MANTPSFLTWFNILHHYIVLNTLLFDMMRSRTNNTWKKNIFVFLYCLSEAALTEGAKQEKWQDGQKEANINESPCQHTHQEAYKNA